MRFLPLVFLVVVSMSACKKDEAVLPQPIVFSAAGDINAELEAFRAQLGELNTSEAGSGGRREINWDGVPVELMEKSLPLDFFNPTSAGAPIARQRGLVYPSASPGSFRVSNSGFADINAKAAPDLPAFSGSNSFANISAKLWDMTFQVPGKAIPARINGFGAVFSGVDKEKSTAFEFFNGNQSLGKFYVPVRESSSSFSFLGVYFPDASVTRISVSHEGILSDNENDVTNGGSSDLIVLDDFVYSEPIE